MNKKSLAITLSKLKVFEDADMKLEQYPTDSEIAAEILWNAYMSGDIQKKIVADLGCGSGIIGIGALMLGAKKAYFVDIDSDVLEILKENLGNIDMDFDYEILNEDISDFNKDVDLVLQNPPFGTKNEHVDVMFLKKAFESAPKVYSFHKTSTAPFIRQFALKSGFDVTSYYEFRFPLKNTMKHHKKNRMMIDVCCFKFEKTTFK